MQSLNEPDPKEALLASDARLTLVAQNTLGDPIVHQGKAEVMNFFQGYEHAAAAREFLSVDGGAFLIQVEHGMPHPRMGILVFEVNPDGKIQNIKVWTGDLRDDTADLNDNGLTGVGLKQLRAGALQKCSVLVEFCQMISSQLGRSVCAGAAGTTEHTECQRSGSQPSLQQMRRFNTSAEKVKALDMGAVVAVLVQRDGYSPTKAVELAEEYRKYLALVGAGLQPVPSKKVDDAWHAHMLNTKKYAADTQALLGHFLHHEPANLLLDQQGMQEQKASMDNMFASTKMQICDFYGRVNEDAWAKEDVALCAPCTCSSEACGLLMWVVWVCFPRHCPTCPSCAGADADAHAVAAVAVHVAGERCRRCSLRDQSVRRVLQLAFLVHAPAASGRCLHFSGLARYLTDLRVMPRHDFEASASVPTPCSKVSKFPRRRSSRWQHKKKDWRSFASEGSQLPGPRTHALCVSFFAFIGWHRSLGIPPHPSL